MVAGYFEYRVNGKVHRANGPAWGWKEDDWYWCLFGFYHRYYGPATSNWYLHGKYIK